MNNRFHAWAFQNFPFMESTFKEIDNYHLMMQILHYLKEQLKDYRELVLKVEELENWFKNLDVQDEIDHKLDEMVESGELQEIISEYLNSKAIFGFDTVEDMKSATNLIDGSYVRTFGYYSKGDGGGNLYYISDTSTDDIKSIELDSGLYAISIILENNINSKQYGLHGDKNTDDGILLQTIIDYCKLNNYTLTIDGVIYTSITIDTKGIEIIGVGDKLPEVHATYTSHTYGYIGWDYLKNTGDGALITFDDYKEDVLTTGSGIISDIANPILKCKHKDGKFNLKNIYICGWLRNDEQEGLLSIYENDDTYINGTHHFDNVEVFNCGSNGIHLQSLEVTEINELSCNYNFGHGLYIEGISGIDTPFEYVTFNRCSFGGNKLDGLLAENCYRKQVMFNNCSAGLSGLYRQLGLTVPETTTDIVAGFKIIGKESSKNSTREILEFNKCFGEEVNKLIDLQLFGEGTTPYVANKITIKECVSYPTVANNNYCLAYFDTYYTDNFSFYNNFFNGSKPLLISSRSSHIVPLTVDYDFYTQYNNVHEPTLNSNLTKKGSSLHRYGNQVHIQILATANNSISAWDNLLTNLIQPDKEYFASIYVDGVYKQGFINTNKTVTLGESISNGAKIIFDLIYFANPYTS